MLFNVVDKKWGTAFNIKDELLSMAGKTGTCQVDYTSEEVQYISSFVGYYPVENPKYSCIVVIHRPNKSIGYYGSTVAAPVFKTIAKKIFNDIPKKIEISYSAFADLENNTVPNVKGLNQKEAIKKLKNKGMTVKVKGKGIVKSQSIKPGSKIKNQQKIIIESS
jgi:cell division protein FtsI (penicillin-binding protein 3)